MRPDPRPPASFGLHWPGKDAAREEALKPATGRLVAQQEGRWQDDPADHMLISGDNLEALRLLLPAYGEKVRFIFIDPPYNTGSGRFLYPDDFSNGADRHSAWLSMMLPRLMLARELLREDGVIFISIGDDEVHHLGLLLQEVFGEAHFVANLLWRRRKTQANLSRLIAPVHDYILCFAKDRRLLRFNKIGYSKAFIEKTFANPDNDPRGPYQTRPLAQPAASTNKPYTLRMPNGREITAHWSCTPETFQRYIAENRLFIPKAGAGMPRLRIFLAEGEGSIPNTWLDDAGTYEDGSRELRRLFGSNAFFISPKPTTLIRRLLDIAAGPDDIVLDFFAGSGTTAHAVIDMNEADGGRRRSISVQSPEPVAGHSLPGQNGYHTIDEICRERILRVLDGINRQRVAIGAQPVHLRYCRIQPL